ncbi:MAG: hypothetical protein ACTTH7_03675 [Treponema sp.]
MIIDIPNEKGYVIDTDKILPKSSNLYVIYFSENRAKEMKLSNATIKECKKDTRHRIAWYENSQFKSITEEKY